MSPSYPKFFLSLSPQDVNSLSGLTNPISYCVSTQG
jgi:hypothetical protein